MTSLVWLGAGGVLGVFFGFVGTALMMAESPQGWTVSLHIFCCRTGQGVWGGGVPLGIFSQWLSTGWPPMKLSIVHESSPTVALEAHQGWLTDWGPLGHRLYNGMVGGPYKRTFLNFLVASLHLSPRVSLYNKVALCHL